MGQAVQRFFSFSPDSSEGSEVQVSMQIPSMASFLNISRLYFKFWKVPQPTPSIGCAIGTFFWLPCSRSERIRTSRKIYLKLIESKVQLQRQTVNIDVCICECLIFMTQWVGLSFPTHSSFWSSPPWWQGLWGHRFHHSDCTSLKVSHKGKYFLWFYQRAALRAPLIYMSSFVTLSEVQFSVRHLKRINGAHNIKILIYSFI